MSIFTAISRFFRQSLSKSRTINNEPLNKVSLVVLIIIDIFILVNVFAGLDDIGRWHLSPSEAFPCYSEWSQYTQNPASNKHYQIIFEAIYEDSYQTPPKPIDQEESKRLGTVSDICIAYAKVKNTASSQQNKGLKKSIQGNQQQVSELKQANEKIRAEYDSTLLEKIAGQPRNQSINKTGAEKAKQNLDENTQMIARLGKEISELRYQLINTPESQRFIRFLNNKNQFTALEKGYDNAFFWYPSIRLFFQSIFLLPLIAIGLLVHNFAQRKGYGLISLISWHLLVIFFIPLVIKVFQFLQIGIVFQVIFDLVSVLLGGLLFLISYVYIFLIPLIGFVIIKIFQKFVFNTKRQAANRVQYSRCLRCAKKIQPGDRHCPHCGFGQYQECENCHTLTYKQLPYCRECGHSPDSAH